MGHTTQIKELLAKDGNKWQCDACGEFDWAMIDYRVGPVTSKVCCDCWEKLQELDEILKNNGFEPSRVEVTKKFREILGKL